MTGPGTASMTKATFKSPLRYRKENLPDFPRHIDIDLSTKCNLRCRFCHLSYFKPKSWTQMSLSQFEKLLPLLPHLDSISLFSKYEVLTCRDFSEIFDLIASYNIQTYFSTNGLLINHDVINTIVGKLTYPNSFCIRFTDAKYEKNMAWESLKN